MRVFPLAAALALFLAGCSGSTHGLTSSSSSPHAPTGQHDVVLDGTNTTLGAGRLPAELQGNLSWITRSTGHRGGEPNIGITHGAIYVTAGLGVEKSTDLGKTWTEAFNLSAFWGPLYDPSAIPNSWPNPPGSPCVVSPPLVGCPGPDQVAGLTRSSDDMLWVDPDTDRVFADFMTGLYCSKLFFSDDEGGMWTPSPLDCGVPVNDHQKVVTAHWGPDTMVPPDTVPVYPNLVYYCYNKLLASDCAVSYDGGLTFQYDRPTTYVVQQGEGGGQPVLNPACTGGINGHPAGAPDGTLYLPINLGCPGPLIMASTNNGLTWAAHLGPTQYGADEIDPEITVTPDGTAYMLWRGHERVENGTAKDYEMYLIRSNDRFATWQGPWRVSPPDVHSTVFAGLTSGDDGRIAFAYLGTRDWDGDPSSAPNATRWHLYTGLSLDAEADAPTFRVQQATADDSPVQIGCVWLSGGGNPCRNMLDFIDMHHTPDGRPIVVFSDGCVAQCDGNLTATNLQSRNRYVTIGLLDTGPSLLAATGRFNGS